MEKRVIDNKAIAAASKHFEKFYCSEVFTDIINNFASGMRPNNTATRGLVGKIETHTAY
jgi:hypothetical protein